MVCVIQYKNAGGEEYFYPVPFYDITTYGHEPGHKVLIPWCIQGPATKYAGTIEFSILFFRLDANSNIIYMLNTLPAKSKILQGQNWDFKETTKNQITSSYVTYKQTTLVFSIVPSVRLMCQRISPNLYNFLKSKFSIDIFSEWVPIWENVENLQ